MIRRIATLVAIALTAAACGAESTPAEVENAAQGFVVQGDESLSEDAPTSTTTTVAEGAGGAAESAADDPEAFESTTGTLPQNEDDESAIGGLFEAFAIFRTCLDDEGYSFIGPPDPTLEADDPVNDSGYGTALGKCAALSDIQNAVAAQQSESANMNAEEIETRNRQLVYWTDCMEGRGFVISGISADENGLNQPTGIEGPDGQSLFDSDDMAECATVAAEAYDSAVAAEEGTSEGSDG
jgi:hypothetical protein